MAVYTVRPGFTVRTPIGVFVGGDEVDLDELLFAANKHKLENVERDEELDIDFGVDNSDESISYPAPFVSGIFPNKLFINSSVELTIEGSFFTPDTTFEIEGVTVRDVEFVNSHLVVALVECGNTEFVGNLIVNNGSSLIIESAVQLFDPVLKTIDLREGGTNFSGNAIEVRNGMSFARTASGLRFNGRNPFSSWARFVGDDDAWVWNREDKRSLSWIFTNNSSFMLGIGSRENAVNNGSQFSQAEIMGYFPSRTTFTGLYGYAIDKGSTSVQGETVAVNSNSIKKIVFTRNGEKGSFVAIYDSLSSDSSTWATGGILRNTFTVTRDFGGEDEIMPFVIPRDGANTLFLGFVLL